VVHLQKTNEALENSARTKNSSKSKTARNNTSKKPLKQSEPTALELADWGFNARNLMRETESSTISARSNRFSYFALVTNSTGIHRSRSRTKARNSSTHSMDNCTSRSCNRMADKRKMDSHTNPVRNSCSQNKHMYMTFLSSPPLLTPELQTLTSLYLASP
jgi:hypothetical protein